jgi:hypothetical protein
MESFRESAIPKTVRSPHQGHVTPKPTDRFRISQRPNASIFRAQPESEPADVCFGGNMDDARAWLADYRR